MQKFGLSEDERQTGRHHPLLSNRRNLVVIVDEAHRSHDDLDGTPATSATPPPERGLHRLHRDPIAFADRNAREAFGDLIDTYDLTRAVADGATVPVYFEPRLILVALSGAVTEEQLDEAADEATQGLDDVEREPIEKPVAVINRRPSAW